MGLHVRQHYKEGINGPTATNRHLIRMANLIDMITAPVA